MDPYFAHMVVLTFLLIVLPRECGLALPGVGPLPLGGGSGTAPRARFRAEGRLKRDGRTSGSDSVWGDATIAASHCTELAGWMTSRYQPGEVQTKK
jgi:hypothetical protein